MPSETLEFIKLQILELVLNFLTSAFKVPEFKVQSYQILNSKFFQMMLKAKVLNISFESFSYPISKILGAYLKVSNMCL